MMNSRISIALLLLTASISSQALCQVTDIDRLSIYRIVFAKYASMKTINPKTIQLKKIDKVIDYEKRDEEIKAKMLEYLKARKHEELQKLLHEQTENYIYSKLYSKGYKDELLAISEQLSNPGDIEEYIELLGYHPDKESKIYFSGIWISKPNEHALIAVSAIYGTLSGVGDFIILKKIKNEWIIEEIVNMWVS